MSVMRVRVNINDVDPNTDVSELARRIGELVRNLTGGEVAIDIQDNDPRPNLTNSRGR